MQFKPLSLNPQDRLSCRCLQGGLHGLVSSGTFGSDGWVSRLRSCVSQPDFLNVEVQLQRQPLLCSFNETFEFQTGHCISVSKQTSSLFFPSLKEYIPCQQPAAAVYFYILFFMHKAGCSFPRTSFATKNVSPNFGVKNNKQT